MNVNQMITELTQRLEDSSGSEFTSTIKIDALNNAQDRLVALLNSKYLTELETLEKYTNSTNEPKMVLGLFNLATLSNPVLNGSEGILAVKIHNEKYMNRLSMSDVKQFDSGMVESDLSDPYYVVFADRIELVPPTTLVAIPLDVYYMKKPTLLIVGGECDLNAGLHYLVVGLAEAYCWTNSEKYIRSREAEKIVIDQVSIMNMKLESKGV
tara:strand:+ start:411 stop:1043 length:633 start_codon:yes stop_codon:yes gene_type:complete